jgi:hypothetical protein
MLSSGEQEVLDTFPSVQKVRIKIGAAISNEIDYVLCSSQFHFSGQGKQGHQWNNGKLLPFDRRKHHLEGT